MTENDQYLIRPSLIYKLRSRKKNNYLHETSGNIEDQKKYLKSYRSSVKIYKDQKSRKRADPRAPGGMGGKMALAPGRPPPFLVYLYTSNSVEVQSWNGTMTH